MRTYLMAGLIGLFVGGPNPLPAQESYWPRVQQAALLATAREPKADQAASKAKAEAIIRTAKAATWPEIAQDLQAPSADLKRSVETSPTPKMSLDGISLKGPTDNRFDTATMIAPLQEASGMLGRLELSQGLLENAQVISSGTRTDNLADTWVPETYTWISPVFYHQPLYFEQPNLERYGLGGPRIAQPLLSSAHFFSSIPLVPYKTLTHHPREKVYTLGQGRPGNCVPIQRRTLLGQSTVGEVFWYWDGSRGY